MACLIRVPSEVIKQRVQAKQHSSVKQAIRFCYKENGFSSFYRGFFITIFRDVPFAMIQYPLWEYFKQVFQSQSPTYNALCGSMAGAIAAAITTPLDVIKTQIMLNKSRKTKGIGTTSLRIYNQHGPTKFFSGVLPRVSWMSLGGYIYFGVYEYMKRMQFEKMK